MSHSQITYRIVLSQLGIRQQTQSLEKATIRFGRTTHLLIFGNR